MVWKSVMKTLNLFSYPVNSRFFLYFELSFSFDCEDTDKTRETVFYHIVARSASLPGDVFENSVRCSEIRCRVL